MDAGASQGWDGGGVGTPKKKAAPKRGLWHQLPDRCLVSAASATAGAGAGAGALFAGLGLVYGEGAAVFFLAVEGGDGGLGLLIAAHLNETEALGAAGVAVGDDVGR